MPMAGIVSPLEGIGRLSIVPPAAACANGMPVCSNSEPASVPVVLLRNWRRVGIVLLRR